MIFKPLLGTRIRYPNAMDPILSKALRDCFQVDEQQKLWLSQRAGLFKRRRLGIDKNKNLVGSGSSPAPPVVIPPPG